MSLKIGAHIQKHNGSVLPNIEKVKKKGFDYFQIFLTGPKNYTVSKELRYNNINQFAEKVKKNKYNLIAHGSYVDFPWKGANPAIANIKKELSLCKKIGIKFLVIHFPVGDIKMVTEQLDKIKDSTNSVKILLEINSHKKGPLSWEDPTKLNDLFSQIKKKYGNKYFGLCLDTAHLWASGIDLSNKNITEKWFNDFKYKEYIKVIHLNDTSTKLNSGRDIHHPIGTNIWRDDLSSLEFIIDFTIKNDVIVILEPHSIEKGERSNIESDIKIIENIIKK
jgi:endonuclease IV